MRNHSTQLGYTLLELLAASSMGLLLLGLTFTSAITGKQALRQEFEQTKMSQDLRSAIDLLGVDIRLTGEQLPSSFPAVELIDGNSGGPDQLILRRNLLSEVLTVCSELAAGTSTSQVIFASGDGTVDVGVQSPACIFDDPGQRTNFDAWREFRARNGGPTDAFIFNIISKEGEFFKYLEESTGIDTMFLTRGAGSWQSTYPYISSSIYAIEEHRFRLVDGVLEIIRNRDWAAPQKIVSSLKDFQVTVTYQDGTTANELPANGGRLWTDIRGIQVELAASETVAKRTMRKRLSNTFYPRNILSN